MSGATNLIRSWGRILQGRHPTLSIEITRECPLRCPGCYAYEDVHLGEAGPLRSLADYRGGTLVERVMGLVEEHRPVYLSVVGGEPLVRFRELEEILPRVSRKGITTQLVTSAVRPIPASFRAIPNLHVVVSIDGLQPEHDLRRAPATYERILKNIEGSDIKVHCTVTRQMAERAGAFEEFVSFWSSRPEVRHVWFSLFTPQRGAAPEETLPPRMRERILSDLSRLRPSFPKLFLPDTVVEGYLKPPDSPESCLFARTTLCVTADLRSRITPCQIGGDPDCSQCGCMASAGLKTVGDYRLLGILPLRALYEASDRIGRAAFGTREKPWAPVRAPDRTASPD